MLFQVTKFVVPCDTAVGNQYREMKRAKSLATPFLIASLKCSLSSGYYSRLDIWMTELKLSWRLNWPEDILWSKFKKKNMGLLVISSGAGGSLAHRQGLWGKTEGALWRGPRVLLILENMVAWIFSEEESVRGFDISVREDVGEVEGLLRPTVGTQVCHSMAIAGSHGRGRYSAISALLDSPHGPGHVALHSVNSLHPFLDGVFSLCITLSWALRAALMERVSHTNSPSPGSIREIISRGPTHFSSGLSC